MQRILTPEETEQRIFAMIAAGLSGRPLDGAAVNDGSVMRREDILAAIEKFKRSFFEKFESLPDQVGATFEQREKLRAFFDHELMEMGRRLSRPFEPDDEPPNEADHGQP